jgi:prolyl oligopeptidase
MYFTNVRANVPYPTTLITTGDHDDRVFPAHSFKFAAAMQNADPQGQADPDPYRLASRSWSREASVEASGGDRRLYSFVLNAMGLEK